MGLLNALGIGNPFGGLGVEGVLQGMGQGMAAQPQANGMGDFLGKLLQQFQPQTAPTGDLPTGGPTVQTGPQDLAPGTTAPAYDPSGLPPLDANDPMAPMVEAKPRRQMTMEEMAHPSAADLAGDKAARNAGRGNQTQPAATVQPAQTETQLPPSAGVRGITDAAAKKYGIDPNDYWKMVTIESRGNPRAFNKGSKAAGLLQFIPGTAKQYGLSNPFDPYQAADAGGRLWRDNKAYLTNNLGREPSAGEIYLAHQQGPKGAVDLLRNPAAPAASVVSNRAILSNGGWAGMSAGQFANLWVSRFNSTNPNSDAMSRPSGSDWTASSPGGPGGTGGVSDLWGTDTNTALAGGAAPHRHGGSASGGGAAETSGSPTRQNQIDPDTTKFRSQRSTARLRKLSPVATIQALQSTGAALRGGKGE